MQKHDLEIPGVAGDVAIVTSVWWPRPKVTLSGQAVHPDGGVYRLPTFDGRGIVATLPWYAGLEAFPSLIVDDLEYRSGPAQDQLTWGAMLSPLLVLFLFGIVPTVCSVAGLMGNLAIVRTDWERDTKVYAMFGVAVAALVLALVLRSVFAFIGG